MALCSRVARGLNSAGVILPPMRTGYASMPLMRVRGLMPEWPSRRRVPNKSRSLPRGVTTPRPVITTRRLVMMYRLQEARNKNQEARSKEKVCFAIFAPCVELLLGALLVGNRFDVIDGLANGLDLFGLFVGDGHFEL